MIKTIFAILLSVYTANVFASFGGNIGVVDDRRYGSLSDPDYRGVVKVKLGAGGCTGGFISKNLVITNSHCAVLCKNGCTAEFWNGSAYDKSSLRVVAYYPNYETLNGTDWAILLSDKENKYYISSIAANSTPGQIHRGGFGGLRIIEDDEIPYLQDLWDRVARENEARCKKEAEAWVDCINKLVEGELKKQGKQPLMNDGSKFKIQTCKIIGNHPKSNKMVQTDCDSASGDSGAPLLRSNQLVGLNNSGTHTIFSPDESKGANGVKTENFYKYAQELIAKYENYSGSSNNASNTVPSKPNNTNPATNTNSPTAPTSSPITDEQKIQQMLEQQLQSFDCD